MEAVLVRSASQGASYEGKDPYITELASIGVRAVCAPVLRFSTSDSMAMDIFKAFSEPSGYSGLIFTSQRAVEAVAGALAEHGVTAAELGWGGRPVYVVGEKTSKCVSMLIAGAQVACVCGTAAELAEHIVDQHPQGDPAPLLFLTGTTRMNHLPDRLNAAGVPWTELTSYRSDLIDDPPEHIASHLTEHTKFLVFYSPRGAKAVIPDLLPKAILHGLVIIAMGPTTGATIQYLCAGQTDIIVCEAPKPQGLVTAIERFRQQA